MTLTKAAMAARLMEAQGLVREDAFALVELFFLTIRKTLAEGDEVKLAGLGNFELRDKRQRPGQNPKTNVSIPVEARRVVTFKPSNLLKEGHHQQPRCDRQIGCPLNRLLHCGKSPIGEK